MSHRLFLALVFALSVVGCDDGDAPEDGGTLADAGPFDGGGRATRARPRTPGGWTMTPGRWKTPG